jgi:hypothetical protein
MDDAIEGNQVYFAICFYNYILYRLQSQNMPKNDRIELGVQGGMNSEILNQKN